MNVRYFKFGLMAAAIFLLVACEKGRSAKPMPLTSEMETLEFLAPDCASGDDCTSVAITREVFAGQPALNEAIQRQLLQQLQGNGGESGTTGDGSLEDVAEAFIAEAAQAADISAAPWDLSGEAKTLGRRGNLLTVEVSTYIYSGGAHGMPATHWLNWDLTADKEVTLDDVIKPQQEMAFWELVEAAHKRWLDKQKADDDFRNNWPFARTEDFRFDDEGMVLLYGVYTLAPYSSGFVELKVPREALNTVVLAPYLAQK
ncbi:DUF3298 and DUF4163 domain-containing protein [Microbulbifer aggregans]|uniref:DUF3298 and DUF4163 domain-containing protein n=1 Tax=Microbulbifer aggregans TaxID=1769779 RepID=UPI001CFDE7D7|nr:DUF3298 and DUF4163 domain-containing protein [Microbulbifer aggregans]